MEVIRDSGKKEAAGIQVNEGELRKHVSEIVRGSVEDTLNAMLETEADTLCQARRYERNAERASTRAGHYTRSLQTTSGEVKLKIPKLRNLP
ncbi:MAG: transposase, partial [Desulfovibrionaceae bacterium]|nr:transposase [Desulfovibrionaceae bacterium]